MEDTVTDRRDTVQPTTSHPQLCRCLAFSMGVKWPEELLVVGRVGRSVSLWCHQKNLSQVSHLSHVSQLSHVPHMSQQANHEFVKVVSLVVE